MEEEEVKFNPWDVCHIDDFLYYCCPECEEKSESRSKFVHHALVHHPVSKDFIPKIMVSEVKDDFTESNQIKSETYDADTNGNDEFDPSDFLEQESSQPIENANDLVHVKSEEKVQESENLTKDSTNSKKSPKKYNAKTLVQCYFCGDKMEHSKIKSHMTEVHGRFKSIMYGTEERKHQCPSCKILLKSPVHEVSHVCQQLFEKRAKDVTPGPKKCDICNKVYKSHKSLRKHKLAVHIEGVKPYQCDQCNFESKHYGALKRHRLRKHEGTKPFACEKCSYRCITKWDLTQHDLRIHQKQELQDSSNLQTFTCEICGGNYGTKKTLEHHQISSHGISPEKYMCKACGKAYANQLELERHETQQHSQDGKCTKCFQAFPNLKSLNSHLEKCLEDPKKFQCKHCKDGPSEFWHSHLTLKRHLAEYHFMFRAVCDICGLDISNASYLEKHKKVVHEGLYDFSCHHCGKLFSVLPLLRTHLATVHQDGDAYFKCDICDYTCSSGRNLADHKQAVHLKTNKLKCDQCEYSTFRKACLANHILYVHRKVKNFSCDLCEKKFAYRRERKKHMESKHGILVTS